MSRTRKKIKPHFSIGIFCEGASEKQYFDMLNKKYRRGNVVTAYHTKIKVKDAGASGRKLIETANQHQKQEKFDKVYVVFDRDDHSRAELQHCEKLAERYNIKVIFSSISFEIWILMHFESVMKSYTRKGLYQKLSGKKYFGQDYRRFKGSDYTKYLEDKVQTAKLNAEQLYQKNNKIYDDDPFTNVDKAIKEIYDIDQF